MQFPYDPNYGDSQSQSSRTAADHLVQEVGVKVADQVFFSTLINCHVWHLLSGLSETG